MYSFNTLTNAFVISYWQVTEKNTIEQNKILNKYYFLRFSTEEIPDCIIFYFVMLTISLPTY